VVASGVGAVLTDHRLFAKGAVVPRIGNLCHSLL